MIKGIMASALLVIIMTGGAASAETVQLKGSVEYFYWPSCQPCKEQDKHLDQWIWDHQEELSHIKVEKINIKENVGEAIDRGFPIGLPNPSYLSKRLDGHENIKIWTSSTTKPNSALDAARAAAELAKNEADNAIIKSHSDIFQGTPYLQFKDAEGKILVTSLGVQNNKILTRMFEEAFHQTIREDNSKHPKEIQPEYINRMPIIDKLAGKDGFPVTNKSSIEFYIEYSNATEFRYRVDLGEWTEWKPVNTIDKKRNFTVFNVNKTSMPYGGALLASNPPFYPHLLTVEMKNEYLSTSRTLTFYASSNPIE